MMLYGPAHSESRLGSLESMILYWCHGSKDCGQISLSASDNDATPLLGNIGGKVEQRLYGLQEDLWVRVVTGQERNDDLHHQDTDLLARLVRCNRSHWRWCYRLVTVQDLVIANTSLCLDRCVLSDYSIWLQGSLKSGLAESLDLFGDLTILRDDALKGMAIGKCALRRFCEAADQLLEKADSSEVDLVG